MKPYVEMFFYNSLVMSILTLCFLISFKFLQKRYSAKWLYGILLFITALWVFPFRPQIEIPSVLSAASENGPVLLPFVFEGIAQSSALPDMAINPAQSLSLWAYLGVLWGMGIVALSAYYAIRHHRFMRFVSRWSVPVTDGNLLRLFENVKEEVGIKKPLGFKQCKSIETPMLIGLWNVSTIGEKIFIQKCSFSLQRSFTGLIQSYG